MTAKPRQPVKKISKRKLEANGGVMPFSSISKRGGKPKPNAKRAKKRTDRTHGPQEFREFTKEQPCKACGRLWHSENAHVLGNGGTGRKKDWTTVAPLCGPHPDAACDEIVIGCHKLYDDYRWKFAARFPSFDPQRAVDEHQAAWTAFRGAPVDG